MESLPLSAVKPGSVLAVAVTDARGNVLVGEGRVLSEEWINRLKARGIQRVTVRDEAPAALAPGAPGSPAHDKRLERLELMFARAPQDELMRALADAARQVLLERRG